MIRLFWIAALAATQLARGQAIDVYSEFRRIDPFGKIVNADRGGTPREILSPMAARNAFAGFHIAVTPRPDQWFALFIGLNPENAVKVQVYRESFKKVGEEWLPDGVTPVALPYQARLPEDGGIPGQTTIVFWLEFWVAPDAPVERIKVQPQISVGDDWISYPMEVRILSVAVPKQLGRPSIPLAAAQRADAAAVARMRRFVCGDAAVAAADLKPDSLAYFLDRAVLQDMALAGANRTEAIGHLLRAMDLSDSKAWCESQTPPANPEWHLRFRDALLRSLSGSDAW